MRSRFSNDHSFAGIAVACVLIFCVAVSPVVASEQERVVAIKAWIKALNAGESAMAEVRDQHVRPRPEGFPDWRPQFRQMRAEFAPLQLSGLLAQGGNSLEALVDGPAGPMTISFVFDQDDLIKGLRMMPGHGGGSDLPSLDLPKDPAAQKKAITEYLEALVEEDQFSGTVLIARPSGEVFYQGAFGLASREFGVANQLSTRFDVGSINKDYTHLGVLLLAKDGKIDLQAMVGKYLPDFAQVRVRNEVTVQQLIDHTSGVRGFVDERYKEVPMRTLRDIDDYLPIWAGLALHSEPGDEESYSDFGYTILGAIIEAVSGQSYPDFVQERIFDPAGMTGTGFFSVDSVTANVAVGYTNMGPDYQKGEQLWKNIFLEPAVGGPWGKSYSPAIDLFRFYQKLFRHQLIPAGEAWFPGGGIEGFGLALGGGGPGLNAMMSLERGWMVIALANLDPPSAGAVSQVLIGALAGN